MEEVVCANCTHEFEPDESTIMVNDGYLCDTTCLAEHLVTHGIVALTTGRE